MGTAFEDYEEPVNRTCKKCGEVKPLEQFQLHGKYWDTTCKLCRKDEVREWQKNNPDKMAANNKRWLKRTIAKAHEADETIAALTAEVERLREALQQVVATLYSDVIENKASWMHDVASEALEGGQG
jgi:beta-phosphoglucomutase-like phosphatase (HAD superfamily)